MRPVIWANAGVPLLPTGCAPAPLGGACFASSAGLSLRSSRANSGDPVSRADPQPEFPGDAGGHGDTRHPRGSSPFGHIVRSWSQTLAMAPQLADATR